MGLIIGQGTKSGGGGASSAEKALAQATTLDGRLYNLWEVLSKVKADPRVSGYACIMLAEYRKGYNQLLLKGADAFLTCDGDFYQMSSTSDKVTHYWRDTNSGMMNRWVAFLFTLPNTDYLPSNAEAMPINILVDGQLGTINTGGIASRIQNFWTTEGSSISEIYGYYSAVRTSIVGDINIGVVNDFTNAAEFYTIIPSTTSAVLNIVCKIKKGTTPYSNDGRKGNLFCTHGGSIFNSLVNIELPILESFNGCLFSCFNSAFQSLYTLRCDKLSSLGRMFYLGTNNNGIFTNLRRLIMPNLTSVTSFYGGASTSITLFSNLIHMEFGDGFNSNLVLSKFAFANCLLTDSNSLVDDVSAHPTWTNLDQWLYNFEHLIVDKLADLSGQTAKTITLAAAPYAAITDNIKAKMTAKNWNLASVG